MDSRTEKLRERTKEFAIRIIRLFQALPQSKEAQIIGGQLLRCGTAVGANYRAACHSRSRADFISKMGIVVEEADESVFWIELLTDLGIMKKRTSG
jgi:four helix bundle protein